MDKIPQISGEFLPEAINITLRIKNPGANIFLTNLDLLFAFDYETSDVVDMKMETLAHVQLTTNSPISKAKIIGDLYLK